MSQTANTSEALKVPTQVVDNTGAQAPAKTEAPISTGTPDPRLEQLTRKERTLSRQMRDFQAQKQTFEAEKAKMADQIRAEMRQQFMEDPTKMGLSYEDISNRWLKQPSPEEQREIAAQREIETLRQAQADLDKKLSQSQVDAYEQAKKQISREVSSLVDANKSYELVKAQGAHEAVVSLIEETYKEDGVLMTTEEALNEVEDYLTEQALTVARLEKIQAKLKPAAETPAVPESQPAAVTSASKPGRVKQTITVSPSQTRQSQVQTTLTHAMTQASTKPQGTMSNYERALMAFKGQLNK